MYSTAISYSVFSRTITSGVEVVFVVPRVKKKKMLMLEYSAVTDFYSDSSESVVRYCWRLILGLPFGTILEFCLN